MSVSLVGFLMFGNLLRECGCLERLSQTAQNDLANLITLLLGITISISSAVSVTAATNAPATKVSRQQCEAVTKSGNRCKRNAVVGGKLCRQHQKIADVKSGKK